MSKNPTAEGFALVIQFFEKTPEDIAFARTCRNHVTKIADRRLSDSVNAPETLLQTIRIPWEIVVHHQIRVLKVDTFPAASVATITSTSGS